MTDPIPSRVPLRGSRSLSLLPQLLTWRLLVVLGVFLVASFLPVRFDREAFKVNFHGAAEAPTPLSRFSTWDGEHYLHLAANGYTPGHESNRFYPLWPLLIRAATPLCGGSGLAAALVLAALLAAAACVLLHHFVAQRRSEAVADDTLLLLLAFPGALFFAFPYSESLFLFLVAWTFWSLGQGRLVQAAVAAFLLPLSRPVGLFILLPLAVEVWKLRAWKDRRALLPLAPVLGMAAYFLVMLIWAGDALAGFGSQLNVVSKPSIGRIFDVAGFARLWAMPLSVHGFFDSAIDRAAFLWCVIALVPLRRDLTLLAFALPMVLVPATSTQLMSFTRYAAVVFPVFVATAELFQHERARAWKPVLLGVLLVLQAYLFARHVNFWWAG